MSQSVLFFFESLCLSPATLSSFFECSSLLFQGFFRGWVQRQNSCLFLVDFPCHFPPKKGKEGQGRVSPECGRSVLGTPAVDTLGTLCGHSGVGSPERPRGTLPRTPPVFGDTLGDASQSTRAFGQERKFSPKRKFSAGHPCGQPAKNFGQALQILEKQAFQN